MRNLEKTVSWYNEFKKKDQPQEPLSDGTSPSPVIESSQSNTDVSSATIKE